MPLSSPYEIIPLQSNQEPPMNLAFILLLLWSCQRDTEPSRIPPPEMFSSDFDGFQKDQEAGCDTEEYLEKKLAVKRDSPSLLQATNSGDCTIQ